MSFDNTNFGLWSATSNTNAASAYLYKTTDALATVSASGYFNERINELRVDDVLYISASDGNVIAVVTSVTTNVTIETITSQAGSHYTVFAGEHTTVGGAAAEAITVTGVLATDLVLVTLKEEGAVVQKILTAATSSNTVTVTFDSDPLNDHVVTYQVLRAY